MPGACTASTTTNDEPPIYPAYLFPHARSYTTWARLTCSDLRYRLRAFPGFEGQGIYFFGNHPIKWVRLVGVLIAFEEYERRIRLELDDGSGEAVELVVWKAGYRPPGQQIGSPADLTGVALHSVVKVKGSLSEFRGLIQVNVRKVEVLRDTREEARAWQELVDYRQDVLGSPWLVDEKTLRKEKWKNEGYGNDYPKRIYKERRAATEEGVEILAAKPTDEGFGVGRSVLNRIVRSDSVISRTSHDENDIRPQTNFRGHRRALQRHTAIPAAASVSAEGEGASCRLEDVVDNDGSNTEVNIEADEMDPTDLSNYDKVAARDDKSVPAEDAGLRRKMDRFTGHRRPPDWKRPPSPSPDADHCSDGFDDPVPSQNGVELEESRGSSIEHRQSSSDVTSSGTQGPLSLPEANHSVLPTANPRSPHNSKQRSDPTSPPINTERTRTCTPEGHFDEPTEKQPTESQEKGPSYRKASRCDDSSRSRSSTSALTDVPGTQSSSRANNVEYVTALSQYTNHPRLVRTLPAPSGFVVGQFTTARNLIELNQHNVAASKPPCPPRPSFRGRRREPGSHPPPAQPRPQQKPRTSTEQSTAAAPLPENTAPKSTFRGRRRPNPPPGAVPANPAPSTHHAPSATPVPSARRSSTSTPQPLPPAQPLHVSERTFKQALIEYLESSNPLTLTIPVIRSTPTLESHARSVVAATDPPVDSMKVYNLIVRVIRSELLADGYVLPPMGHRQEWVVVGEAAIGEEVRAAMRRAKAGKGDGARAGGGWAGGGGTGRELKVRSVWLKLRERRGWGDVGKAVVEEVVGRVIRKDGASGWREIKGGWVWERPA